MGATVHKLNPKRRGPLTAKPAPMPMAISELSPPLATFENHLHADLDAYAERYGPSAVADMVRRWEKLRA